MLKLLAIALVSMVLLLVAAPAHADDPITATILDVDDSAFPEVRVILTIADPGGRTVQDLNPASFKAEETGVAAEVTGVQVTLREEVSIGVILTIDASGSMLGAAMEQARTAASGFVQDLPATDQTAIVSFASQVNVRAPLSPDRNAALGALAGLQASGNTALYGAVAESVALAQAVPLPRQAVIFLSDGVDFGSVSATTRDASLQTAAQAQIPFYVIGLGSQIDRAYLQELARLTRGAYLETPDPSGIAGLYEQLSQLLRSQYVVTLRSTAPSNIEDRDLKLVISAPIGSTEVEHNYKTLRQIPTPTPVPPAVAAPPAEEGGSNLALLLLLAVVAVVALVGSGRLVYSRIQARQVDSQIAAMSERARGALPSVAVAAGPVAPERQVYLVIEGPGEGRRIEVRHDPLTLGSGEAAQVRLNEGGEAVGEEHARVWDRDGKLMFHQLDARRRSLLGGNPVTWVSLDNGDEVQIGPYTLRVEMARQSAPD